MLCGLGSPGFVDDELEPLVFGFESGLFCFDASELELFGDLESEVESLGLFSFEFVSLEVVFSDDASPVFASPASG